MYGFNLKYLLIDSNGGILMSGNKSDKIIDIESSHNGIIDRFNVQGLAPAVGAYKYVCAKHYNDIIELEISGMLPLDEKGVVASDDFILQTEKVLDNIAKVIIASAEHYFYPRKSSVTNKEQALQCVTSTLVLMSDMTDFSKVNEVYKSSGMPLTCRAAFAAKELPLAAKGVKIEIRANAIISLN